MVKMKDLTASATKFANRASQAGPDYKIGVQNAAAAQNARAIASADLWQQSVATATAKARFISRLRAAGPDKYATNAAAKGADKGHYADGVRQAQSAWQAGFAPIAAKISALNLPDRGLRSSAANYQRAQMVGQAAHDAKVGAAAA